MKFGEFVSKDNAFWISPKGKVISVDSDKHISVIIKNPSFFGVSKEYVESTYAKYDEPIGSEGKAREEIISHLVTQKHFIRIRRYPNKFWSINLYSWDGKTQDILFGWALDLIAGTNGAKEDDVYMPVKIDSQRGVVPRDLTIGDLAKGKHLSESKIRPDIHLIYIKEVDNFIDCFV